ncbi:tRNA (uracil-5-)-methyltransferase trm9 [Colletotrichum camelliae]|nr:tRNA (uracil-5-)-methyltransferase trm9 [Colletotrichum camelliae]
MGASSGPQPGAGTAVPAADPNSTELPSTLGDSSSAAAAAAVAPSSTPTAQTQTDGQQEDAESYESRHVHTVYEAIAPHFSSTRYKPWPLVSSFLLSLAPGSVGLDAGCGNGKYIGVNPSLYIIASDRSANLVSLARDYQPPFYNENAPNKGKKKKKGGSKKSTTTTAAAAPAETAPPPPPAAAGAAAAAPKNQVLVADSLALPYRTSAFDFAISIAVIHHMSTRERRRAAVAALLSSVRPGGGGQQGGGKVLVMVWALEQGNSRRGWDAGADQDQLVSWVTKASKTATEAAAADEEEEEENKDTTYQRYYHLYREGELEEDVVAVGGRVLESGYERDNWWAVFCRDS